MACLRSPWLALLLSMADPLNPSPTPASPSPASPTGLAGLKIQRGAGPARRRRRWPGVLAVAVGIAVAVGLFGPHKIGRAHV